MSTTKPKWKYKEAINFGSSWICVNFRYYTEFFICGSKALGIASLY